MSWVDLRNCDRRGESGEGEDDADGAGVPGSGIVTGGGGEEDCFDSAGERCGSGIGVGAGVGQSRMSEAADAGFGDVTDSRGLFWGSFTTQNEIEEKIFFRL